MFVKTTRRRRGDNVYEYLSLVESVRDGSKVGHKTLLRLGEVTALRESGQLERIVAALESHLHKERVDVGALAADGAPAVGAAAAVAAVWQRLGLGGGVGGGGAGGGRGGARGWDWAGGSAGAGPGAARARSSMRRSRWWPTGWWHRARSGA